MTTKQYKKVLAMHREGISIEICLASIIEMDSGLHAVTIAQDVLRFIDGIAYISPFTNEAKS